MNGLEEFYQKVDEYFVQAKNKEIVIEMMNDTINATNEVNTKNLSKIELLKVYSTALLNTVRLIEYDILDVPEKLLKQYIKRVEHIRSVYYNIINNHISTVNRKINEAIIAKDNYEYLNKLSKEELIDIINQHRKDKK